MAKLFLCLVAFLACSVEAFQAPLSAVAQRTSGDEVELHLWQSQPVPDELRARIPLRRVLSMCSTPKYADVAVPDWCFDAWPEAGVPQGGFDAEPETRPAWIEKNPVELHLQAISTMAEHVANTSGFMKPLNTRNCSRYIFRPACLLAFYLSSTVG